MRWRAEKVNEYAKLFVQEVRAKRPGLLISLSPAVYPWSWENYLLEWPKWSAWTSADRNLAASQAARNVAPRWDEFIPQVYRFSYSAFEKTWLEQQAHIKSLGADRQRDMLAGIRLVGEGKDATWDELRQSIELVRKTGGGGHVHWFSRGVLDVFPEKLKTFYGGWVTHPRFPRNWRRPCIPLFREPGWSQGGSNAWSTRDITRDAHRLIGFDGTRWEYVDEGVVEPNAITPAKLVFFVDSKYKEVELIADRRHDMRHARKAER
jgi:hypothetical protein